MLLAILGFATAAHAQHASPTSGQYRNFRVAIYVVVNATRALADPASATHQFDRVARQLRFDKVYLEVYRDHNFATDAEIEAAKQFFRSHGIAVSGGITLAAGGAHGQFGTFDYENPADRAECLRAVRLAARHFDEVILDDFFFYTSKSDADIRAKGNRSWTQYRLDTMRAVARDLVLAPARAANPRIRMIVKYPNWYEHFQGLGYDLDREAKMFDAIYTGTETRDPYITDQLLQQYESYEIFRYFSNIRRDYAQGGGNRGGWVDTFSLRYADRYAEQLWGTMFAKAPEITLFSWHAMAEDRVVDAGERPWSGEHTSFNWNDMLASYGRTGDGDPGPGWAHAAGYALEQVDNVVGALGRPIGIAAYKPYQSSGEDFLHNYLGNIGLPIELSPTFPASGTVLLTESAKFDPHIVVRIKRHLAGGGNVIVTSGLVRALHGKGIEDIVEIEHTGHAVLIHDFLNGFGAGNGTSLNDNAHDNSAVLFPELRFYTNDSWPIVRGVAGAKGFPIVLMNRYSKGVVYVLAVPENFGDLYNLPRPLLTQIKAYLMGDFPVRIDSDPQVALFAYDNGTFVVESFRPAASNVTVSVAGEHKLLRDIVTGETPAGAAEAGTPMAAARTDFAITVAPHSYRVFRIE